MRIEIIKAEVDTAGIYQESVVSLINGYLHGLRGCDDIKELAEKNGMRVTFDPSKHPTNPEKIDYLATFRPATTNQ